MDFSEACEEAKYIEAASTTIDPSARSFESRLRTANECLVTAALEKGWTLDPTGVGDKGSYECFRARRGVPLVVVYRLRDLGDRCDYVIHAAYACHGALALKKWDDRTGVSVCGGDFFWEPAEDVVIAEFEKRRALGPRREYAASMAGAVAAAFRAFRVFG